MNTVRRSLASILLAALVLSIVSSDGQSIRAAAPSFVSVPRGVRMGGYDPLGPTAKDFVAATSSLSESPFFGPAEVTLDAGKSGKVSRVGAKSEMAAMRVRILERAKVRLKSVLATFLAFSGGEKYALGPAKNNQVLTFIDGKIVWRDPGVLHSAAGGSSDSVHEPGSGRMPASDTLTRHMGGNPVQTATTTTTSDGISQATADSRYVNISGDTMDGALSITSNGLGLTISGTASGNALHAERLLTVSGSSVFDSNARFNSTVTLNNVTYTFPASDGAGSGKVLKTNAAGQLSWADDNAVGTGLSQASGDSRYVNTSGDTMTGALTINLSSGYLGLKILNTASGNILHAEKDLTSSGTLTVNGTARFKSNLNTVGTISGAALAIMNGNTNYILGSLGIGTTSPKAKLDVTGTISGTTLTISRNGSFSGSLIVQNNIVARSTISGSTINGFNLGSCNGSSQKLLYNNSTQKFECGSDLNSGGTGTFGTGNVITIGDGRYVNTSGDAMTGALTINLSSGFIGLKILNTASGNILHAEKDLTSSGTLTVSSTARFKSNLNTVGTISGAALQIMAGSTNYILGSLGIGTTSPKAKLDIAGTISGTTLTISRNGSFSGSLIVQNNITARNTISGSTINGFNLGSCNGSSQKLLYNNSTQKFECGSDLNSGGTGTFGTGNVITIGDSRYVNTSGDTMTGALTINLSSGFIGLKIIQTASGNILHAEKNLTSSGGLVFEGAASGSSLYVATSIRGAGLSDCTGGNKLLWNATTGRFSCVQDQTGSALSVSSGDARYVNTSGDTMTGALTINLSSGFIGLKILNTASGNILHAEKSLTSSGTLTVNGIARFKNNVNVVGTVSGAALTVMNGVSSILGSLGIGTTSPKAKLEVLGSFSGSRLYAASAFSGAGLTSCSGAGQKLLWNSTTQQFSCSTDLTTGSFSSGNVITIGDSRYVNVSGDTMTGALTINLSSGFLGLKILQTGSGNILHAEKNLTSSGTIIARNNIVTEQGTLITRYGLTFLSGSSLAEISGFSNYVNFREGIGTDSSIRLTSQGNLRNIGSIQAGETLLTAGGTFAARVNYGAGTLPSSVAIGDLNGDGRSDIVIANSGVNSISVFINTGTGSFATKVNYTTGSAPRSVAIGDLNGDGKPDLAVANQNGASVSVFRNLGSGTFAAKADYGAGTTPYGVAIADFNGDGRTDLAVVNNGADSVSILLNIGNGVFASKVDLATGSLPSSVASADLNGDGKQDLLVTNVGTDTASVFFGIGDGTFASSVNYSTGSAPYSVSVGDLNADGKPDVAVANFGSDTVSVLLNTGTGSFASKTDYATGSAPYSVTIGDLDGDGKGDLAVTNSNGNSASTFLNRGNGTFLSRTDLTTGSVPQSIAIGDLNADGKGDLAVANNSSASVSVLLSRPRTILFAAASTGGVVGIGTSTPGAKLSISGAVIISARGDLANARTDSGIVLEVAGTISGTALKLMNNLSVSGSILSLRGITSRGTVSGNNLIVSHSASISGTLLVKTSIASKGSLSGTTIGGFGFGSCTGQYQKLLYNNTTNTFVCGTDALNPVYGSGNMLTVTNARYVNTSGDTMTGSLTINLSSGFIGLKVLQTASGNILHAEKDLSSSGTLTVNGIARFKNNLNAVGTVSGAALTVMNGTSTILGSVGIGNSSPKAKLDVSGTISGTTLTISKNGSFSGTLLVVSDITARGTLSGTNLTVSKSASISGALLVKTSITSKGSLSGVTIAGFSLGSCSGVSQKLLYNNSTQTFECGDDIGLLDNTNSGNVLAIGNARYVKKQGDTMTGALIINLSSGYLGLRILQMASGSILHAEKSLTSSGLLMVVQSTARGSGALVVEQRTNSTGAYITSRSQFNPVLALDSSTGSFKAPHILFGTNGFFDVALWRTAGALNLSGHLLPGLTNKFDLGSSTKRWRSIYLSGGTMFIGTAGNEASISYNTSASRFGIDANTDGTNELSILSTGNVGIGTSIPKAKLDVLGTISGTTLVISKNASFSGSLTVSSSITSRGSVSGSTISGFSLGSCNDSSTSKLLYNYSTQKFECGTDSNPGAGFGLLNLYAIGDARYVLKQGDTMTGTLKSRGYLLASGTTLSEMSGWNEYLNLPHSGIGTNSVTRLTNQGDLTNISTIQSGEANFTRGGTFAAKVDYSTGTTPHSVAIGDMNGDGKQDLATANYTSNTVSVFLNTGTGSFATKVDYMTGTNPYGVAVGDVNGDGKADIVVANITSNSVSVFLNNGNGTFSAKIDYTTGSNPYSVAIGDLNGDGKADLAVANYNSTSVSVFLNTGNGTFSAKIDYTTGSNPYSVAIGDLNGDGKADLAVANNQSTSVSVFLNNGNGTFSAKVDYTAGSNPASVAIGDLNGDGKADLAAANSQSTSVSVFLNNGNGTFSAKVDYTTGNYPFFVAIGDLNGDGKADLAVAVAGSDSVSVFLNNGNGTFSQKVDYGAGSNPHYVVVGDVNGDGKPDLAVANYSSDTVSVLLNQSKTILFASSGTGGAVGIGTPTPGSILAVSGAMLINGNGDILNSGVNAGVALEVVGTASGRVLRASTRLESSGSLIVEGTISGATLRLGNLGICNTSVKKLTYNSTTNNIECAFDSYAQAFGTGNVLVIGDGRALKRAGGTMTGALTINLSSGYLGLKVLQTASGNILHAEKDLTSSGTLTVNGVARFKNNVNVVGTVSGAVLTVMNGTSYFLGSLGIGNTSPKAKLDVRGAISGTTLTVSGNGSFSGSLIVKNNLSGSSFYGAGLGDCNNATSSKLLYNNATGKFGCAADTGGTAYEYQNAAGTFVNQAGDTMTGALTINLSSGFIGLNVLQTASGNILHAEKSLTSSGSLTVVGVARFKNNLNVVGTISGAALTVMNGTSYMLGSVGIGNTSPKANLDVSGTISGTTLVMSKNGSFSGSLIVKNNLSGSSFYGAGLGDCNNATSSKLLYNNATGKFGCASDQVGVATFTYASTVGTFVNQSGDTMTGALTINLSSGYLGLKVLQTASGNILHAEKNLTSSGTIVAAGDILSKNGTAKTKGYVLFSGATLSEMSGFNEYLNIIHSGLGTNSVTRLTNQGDLKNIGTIQSGEAHMRRGGTFATKVNYAAGVAAYGVAAGDLNGDGKADFAVVNYGIINTSANSSLSIYINTGTGSFATRVNYTTLQNPKSVAIGDLNGDGKPDIAIGGDSGYVSIYINKGNGTFATKVDYAVGSNGHVAIGDLNGDGKADLAVANGYSSASISILLNNGNGTFAAKVDYTAEASISSIAIGDINGDSKIDIAVTNENADSLSIFMNNGNGTFATKVDYATGVYPRSVSIGDLNNDNKADLAVANYTTEAVSVFMNNGDGTLATKVDYDALAAGEEVVIGDLNGDGKQDLSVLFQTAGLSIFINNGNGTFAAQSLFSTESNSGVHALADFNGDGKLDVVVPTYQLNLVSVLMNQSKTILYASSGTGGAVGIGTPTPGSALAVSGAVLINANGNIVNTKADARLALEVIGTMSGRVLHAQDVLRSSGSLIVEGNMSGATLQGAGLASCNASTKKLLYNNSTKKFECGTDQGASFAFGSGNVITIGNSRYVRTSGSTMTGALTINLTSGYLGLKVLQTASGNILHAEKSLTSSGTIIAGTDIIAKGTIKSDAYVFSSGTTLAEMSGWNEYVNIVHSGLGTNSVTRLTNQGDLKNIGTIQSGEANFRRGGTFAPALDYTTGSNPESVAIGDLNGDGKADLAVANNDDSSVSIFLNNGNGTFATKVDYTTGTDPYSVAIGDLNGDGKPDLAVTNDDMLGLNYSVSIFLNKGNGTFATKVDYTTGNRPFSVAIGDLNGDGKADLATANYDSTSVSVFLNNGNGTFAAKVDYATGGASASVAIGDLNGDGKADLAVTSAGYVSVLLNKSNGTFAAKVDYTAGTFPWGVAIGDLNGDGKADLAVTNYQGESISVFMNNGNGTFAAKVDYTIGSQVFSVAIGDLNGDGAMDIVTGNGSLSVFMNNGNGTFATQAYYGGNIYLSVAIGDLNGDGKADLAGVKNNSNTVSVFLNLSRTILFASSGTGGAVGIGTPTPGSALAVSGAVLINANGNIRNTAAGASSALEVIGTASGRILHAQDLLRSSGALAIEGVSYFGSGVTIKSTHTKAGASEFTIITDYSSSSNKVFRVSASGAVYADGTYNSNGADYAEWFRVTPAASPPAPLPDGRGETLEPGEVVCIDILHNNSVSRCTRSGDPNVMGIVSTNPAFVGNVISGAEGIIPPGYALIGLIGQVPAKPSLENGPIRPGDSVTSATEPGFVRKASAGESTVGVALEGYDGLDSVIATDSKLKAQSSKLINILISRKNQSLTVETIEQKVLQQIASMNLSDEVSRLVNQASTNLNIDDRVTQALSRQLQALDLASQINGIVDQRLSHLNSSGHILTFGTSLSGAALADLVKAIVAELSQTTATGSFAQNQESGIRNQELQLSELRDQFLILTAHSSQLTASLGSGHTLHAAALNLSSGATISGSLRLMSSMVVPHQFSIINSQLSILSVSGSAIDIGSLFASGSLKVIGNITITGLATFLGDVHIKGDLVLSSRQAGFAVIPVSSTAVTVTFSGAMATRPMVIATPNALVKFGITAVSATGFTIRLKEPATEEVRFSFVAWGSDNPMTTQGVIAPAAVPTTVDVPSILPLLQTLSGTLQSVDHAMMQTESGVSVVPESEPSAVPIMDSGTVLSPDPILTPVPSPSAGEG